MDDWKRVKSQDDMPRRSGDYIVIDDRDPIPAVDFISRDEKWNGHIVAYIGPIPEWEVE